MSCRRGGLNIAKVSSSITANHSRSSSIINIQPFIPKFTESFLVSASLRLHNTGTFSQGWLQLDFCPAIPWSSSVSGGCTADYLWPFRPSSVDCAALGPTRRLAVAFGSRVMEVAVAKHQVLSGENDESIVEPYATPLTGLGPVIYMHVCILLRANAVCGSWK